MSTATQAAPKKKRRTAPRTAPAPSLTARKTRRGIILPGWAELAGSSSGVAGHAGRAAAGQRKAETLADRKAGRAAARVRPFDLVPSLRFGLLVLIACAIATVFVAHVYATRDVLAELQTARAENVRLRLAGQRLRGDFDRMTGPDAVMPRAVAHGLEEGVAYGVPIRLENPD